VSKSPGINDILKTLIAMPTVTQDTAENEKALDYVQEFLAERGMRCERFVNDGYGSLVATTRPTKTPRVMLVGHIDVVPGPEDLFTMREESDKIVGRGAYDMKSAIAAYMLTVDQLRDQLEDYDFGIMLTTDEETRDLGVKHLLHEGYYPKEAAVLFDGAREWQLEKAAKGALYLYITIKDKTGHGSRPWQVNSTSIRMVKLLAEIEQLFPNVSPDTNTLNISAIMAGAIGEACNQIPAVTRAGLDIRTLDQGERDRIVTEIGELCSKYDAECEVFAEFPPLTHNMNDPHMEAFAASVEKITGIKSEGVTSNGASDAAHFLARGISCMVTWPTGGGHHSDNEWIDTEALQDITPILLDYLRNVAHVDAAVIVGQSTTVH
jgi:succinyl-diaminopimelate desuccinylase